MKRLLALAAVAMLAGCGSKSVRDRDGFKAIWLGTVYRDGTSSTRWLILDPGGNPPEQLIIEKPHPMVDGSEVSFALSDYERIKAEEDREWNRAETDISMDALAAEAAKETDKKVGPPPDLSQIHLYQLQDAMPLEPTHKTELPSRGRKERP